MSEDDIAALQLLEQLRLKGWLYQIRALSDGFEVFLMRAKWFDEGPYRELPTYRGSSIADAINGVLEKMG